MNQYLPKRFDRSTRRIVSLSFIALCLAGCNERSRDATTALAESSLSLNTDSGFVITLDGTEHTFNYIGNCTLSPLLSGVAAWQEKPDFESGISVPSLRLNAITENNESIAQIEIVIGDLGYLFEGPVAIEDSSLQWSGRFKKFDRSTLPQPPVETGSVDGSGVISC